jgi:outer membrane receptor protein involved in Fe transport
VEHPVAKRLFVQAVTSYNRTAGVATVIDPLTATPVTINFGGRQAPYNPRFNALLSLNYISQNGFKSGLFLNHNGAFFQDTADPSITPRPRFGSSTSANLLFAYEPSPRGELFLTINNLFDKQQIVFNNVPLSGRRFIFGVKSRF